jgi:hypothetical protein
MMVRYDADGNRDLEMSTSQVVDGIDSKIDHFKAEQTSNQTLNINYLEKIQEGVQAAATVQSTTYGATLENVKSTNRIQETLQDIRIFQEFSQQSSRLQAEKLDATLAAIQLSLLTIASNGRSRPTSWRNRRKLSRTPRMPQAKCCGADSMPEIISDLVQWMVDSSTIPVQMNRLVDIAITVRFQCGKAHYEAIAIPDETFNAADSKAKLKMVKYLQDLRLLLWLLCRKEFVGGRSFDFSSVSQSALVSEANFASSWLLWTDFGLTLLRPHTKIGVDDQLYPLYLRNTILTGCTGGTIALQGFLNALKTALEDV